MELDKIYQCDCMERLWEIDDHSVDLTILDPFIGSGTTAIACIREKRNYVGSELSPRYIDWAEKRINREHQQLTLF